MKPRDVGVHEAVQVHSAAMNAWRRIVSAGIVGAVLWTVLSPLLGALHEAAAGEAVPLCHQAGMQVEVGSMPTPPMPGETPKREGHCPLCIMVFFGAFGAKPLVPPFLAVAVLAQPATPALPQPRPVAALPFLSRAPPVLE